MSSSGPRPLAATLLGASGMVGTEVLYAALSEPRIGSLTAIVRRPLGLTDLPAGSKPREIVHPDFTDYAALDPVLAETDLWFYCVGEERAN